MRLRRKALAPAVAVSLRGGGTGTDLKSVPVPQSVPNSLSGFRPSEVFIPLAVNPPLELAQLLHAHLLEPSLSLHVVDHRGAGSLLGQGLTPAGEAELAVFDLVEDGDSRLYGEAADLDRVFGRKDPSGGAGVAIWT